MNKYFSALITALLSILVWHSGACAHGVVAGYSNVSGIEVKAVYDTGQPMALGQVTVFAPDNPAQPWLRGSMNEQGKFSFIPDESIPGTWSVQVRQAGHGAMVHIPVKPSGLVESPGVPARPFSNLQLALMILSIAWGFVGTALYFSKRKT
ncbi:hypothetical protein [Desulfonatronovibrio hydrogenovorans]|uniref:hypothetical protein n=1 Tax=Desulfonatronovibrio hydrogenovorans TaxID=53245 RepID=UPI000490F921|nr:hypothetical protein [Desulfonatronovibrio hydrogenovorans]